MWIPGSGRHTACSVVTARHNEGRIHTSTTVPAALRTPSAALFAVATLVVPAILAFGCGSSSETESITSPSNNRCALQVTADGSSFSATGGSGSLHITTTRDCQWSAKTDAVWLTIAAPTSGQGEGSVGFSVGANTDPSSRTAGIAVNDQRLDVTQAGKPCELALSSNHESVDRAGGDLSVNVRASSASCTWTASSAVPWISIVSGANGRGDGTVTFHVDAVSGPSRIGNVTIAGQNVQVDQGTGCSYSIGADAFTLDASGGERQVPVTAPAGCEWTAQSQTSWITISSAATGSGPGIVVFRVSPTDGPGRTGTLIVAGRSVAVTQSIGCAYSVAPSSINVGSQPSTTTVQIDAGAGCAWTTASAVPWITIANGSGNGSGQVQVTVAANDAAARTATITIAGRAVTVAQAAGCTYAVAPTSQDVAGDGGNLVVSVTTAAGCSWTASSSVDWITVTTASGLGAGNATFTVKSNASPPRSATVTVAGRSLTVNQASLCRWFFAPESHDFPATGGNGNVLVFVTGACSWTALPNVSWIQITAGGSGVGNGLLQFVVPVNSGASRTGLIAIGGENYVVRQAGQGDQ